MPLELNDLLYHSRPIVYEGSTGAFLRKLGRQADSAPEDWALDNPAIGLSTAEAYVNARAQMILVVRGLIAQDATPALALQPNIGRREAIKDTRVCAWVQRAKAVHG
jgi:hypothetical protein